MVDGGLFLSLNFFILNSYIVKLYIYLDGKVILAEQKIIILNFVGGGWVTTFWFFKSLDIKMVYTLGVYLDI